MNDQLSFGGFDPPPAPQLPDSVFFSVLPDDTAVTEIAACAEAARHMDRVTGKLLERLHITSQWLPLPRDRVTEFVPMAARIAADVGMAPFDVSFDRMLSFRSGNGNYPLVLRSDSDGLMALHQMLGAAMRRFGLGRFAKTAFTPHITMLYDRLLVPERAVTPITWTVREFVLVHSLRGESRHDILGRWPLVG